MTSRSACDNLNLTIRIVRGGEVYAGKYYGGEEVYVGDYHPDDDPYALARGLGYQPVSTVPSDHPDAIIVQVR